tara:strand:- start:168928 stop:169281 length:354 start_codon:yes stop_codon:yes gene_type:complete
MEFSFEYFEILKQVNKTPSYTVMWAAFGVPLLIAVFMLCTIVIPNKDIKLKVNTAIISILGITWILGFITTILFLFTGISGIKLLAIWCTLFVSVSIFYIFHSTEIAKLYENFPLKE